MRSLLTNEQKNHLFSRQFGDFEPIALVSMGDMLEELDYRIEVLNA